MIGWYLCLFKISLFLLENYVAVMETHLYKKSIPYASLVVQKERTLSRIVKYREYVFWLCGKTARQITNNFRQQKGDCMTDGQSFTNHIVIVIVTIFG